ncbi:MAG: C40 family peptidase [Flammeovirgaceae bacterium]|nr:C40 family peptidase [Flammeovirgaceae bacterium]
MPQNPNEPSDSKTQRITIITIIIVVLLFFAIGVVSYKLYQSSQELTENQRLVTTLQKQVSEQNAEKNKKVKSDGMNVQEVFNLINGIMERESIPFVKDGVDMENIMVNLNNLPDGSRKKALTTAILLALRKYPFRLKGDNPKTGFNSPRFIKYVLGFVNLNIDEYPGEYLSSTMMDRFEKVDTPQPGDLMFFSGRPGNIALFFLGEGDVGGQGTGIGLLGLNFPTAIYETSAFNAEFLGYYRVDYPN